MQGLFDLFDMMVAEKLEVDVETFIRVIESENVSDEEQEQIIMGVMEGDENDIQKAKELFELKLRGGLTAQQNLVKDTVSTSAENLINSFNTFQFGPEMNLYIPKQLFPFSLFHFNKKNKGRNEKNK